MGILDNLERYLELDITDIDMQEDIDKERD
jgi:hypothetical protein